MDNLQNMDIDEIQRYFLKERNLNELDDIYNFLNNHSNNNYSDIIKIKNSLEYENEELSKSKSELSKNKSSNDLKDLFDKIDQTVQKQEWNKLPNYIQNDKIREYVNIQENILDKNKYYKSLLEQIKLKSIKKKDIIYNKELCIIETINE